MTQKTILLGGDNSNRANSAFMVGLFTILGVLAFQHIGGYQPCELCYGQRVPYYVGLPILAAIIIFWKSIPIALRIIATLIVAGIFIWSIYLGGFHAGVEQGWWQGPTSCSGAQELNFTDLNNINETRIVPCNIPSWYFLGITFAGYNAIISAIVSGLLLWSAWGQFKRWRAER